MSDLANDKLSQQVDVNFSDSELNDITTNHKNKIYKGKKPYVKCGRKQEYVVFTESRHHGWFAYLTTLQKAKKLLKIEDEIFYIFKYNYTKKTPFYMKLHQPFGEYYKCLSINEYQEYVFEKNDDYIIVTQNDKCNEENYLILTYKLDTLKDLK